MENQGFQCDICSEIITMVQNLKRHYCNKHHLSREEASQRTEGLKENKTVCPQCNKSIIRVDKHVCPKEQFSPLKGQRAAKKQNYGYVLPSTSGACALPSSSMTESTSTDLSQLALSEDQSNRTGSNVSTPIAESNISSRMKKLMFFKFTVEDITLLSKIFSDTKKTELTNTVVLARTLFDDQLEDFFNTKTEEFDISVDDLAKEILRALKN